MTFTEKLKEISPHIDDLLKLKDLLTPNVINAMNDLSRIDWDNAALMTGAHNQMLQNMQTFDLVLNGISDIQNVAKLQNQVRYVSDIRDQIGIVSGAKEDIKEVAETKELMMGILAMKPMMDDILSLSNKMDMVLDVKEELHEVTFIADRLRDDIAKTEQNQTKAEKSVEMAADMLSKMNIVEHRIDEKLKRVEAIDKSIKDLKVVVKHVGSETDGSSEYNPKTNTLKLFIPAGKKGDKGMRGIRGNLGKQGLSGKATREGKRGAPGKDGKDFQPSLYGNLREKTRYGNRPVGTSFLSLDETPNMIYFKKSNALDHWTDGQPFGVSNGDIELLVGDSQKLNGFTLDQIFEHIETNVNNILNSKGK